MVKTESIAYRLFPIGYISSFKPSGDYVVDMTPVLILYMVFTNYVSYYINVLVRK
jgi:hypothetical protein